MYDSFVQGQTRFDFSPTKDAMSLPTSQTQALSYAEQRAVSALLTLSRPQSSQKERVGDDSKTIATPLATPAQFDVKTLTEMFQKASLVSPPGTRLLLSVPNQADLKNSAVIRLNREIGTWRLVSLIQHKQDVHSAVDLPIYSDSLDHGKILHHVCFDVYYNPGQDSCVLENTSGQHIVLDDLKSGSTKTQVAPGQVSSVSPGLWRVFGVENQHLLDMFVLHRQFTVEVHTFQHTSSKRKAYDELTDEVSGERFKQKGNDSGILLRPNAAWTLPPIASTPSTAVVLASGTPLWQLEDGNTALVQTKLHQTGGHQSASLTPPNSLPVYGLSRLKRIADTNISSVFTAQHTEHTEASVVVKVIRYASQKHKDLIWCAKVWQQEVSILKCLDHANIMSLKSSDGRLHAMYFEHLPPCLERRVGSLFTTLERHTILRDMSSALEYLKQKEIVHNDIKPANITYSPDRGAVLIDFGFATTEHQEESRAGTPWYMPPECVAGWRSSRKPGGDVWSLGVTMLYVVGRIPLPERCHASAIRRLRRTGEIDPESMEPWLGYVDMAREQLDARDLVQWLVSRMLERDPDYRILPAQIVAAFNRANTV